MKPPWWKAALSYVVELPVEEASSEFNPHLSVTLRNGRYQLSTAKAVYSFADLYSNFDQAFRQIDFSKAPGREVLVLGLGLGSIPILLEKTFRRDFFYTLVEIDEVIIDLAQRYALSDLKSGMEIIQADAAVFVAACESAFDIICMDVFLDDTVPDAFEAAAFLENLSSLLAPGGLLMYNRLAASLRDKRQSRAFFENAFLKVFPEGIFLNVNGNYILLNNRNCLRRQ